jgi:hypothetical protein
MRALPKTREGPAHVRLRNRVVLGGFALSMLAFAGGAAAAMYVGAPAEPARTCFPGQPCGGPPSSTPPLVNGEIWESATGDRLEYDDESWEKLSEAGDSLTLALGDVAQIELSIRDDVGPARVTDRVTTTGLISLPIPHGPNIGYVGGDGAWYEGNLKTGQAIGPAVTVAALASRQHGRTIDVNAIFFATAGETFDRRSAAAGALGLADRILNTVVWGPRRGGDPSESTVNSNVPPGGMLPEHVAKAFNVLPLWQRSFKGQGETVAIVSLDSFHRQDLDAFYADTGIEKPGRVEQVTLDGGPVPVGDGATEVNLDIDVVHAIAPKATILNYEAPNDWDNFVALLERIVADGRASIVSVSWGRCLPDVRSDVVSAMQEVLAEAAEAGITVFVASGDAGAFSCLHTAEDPFSEAEHVETVDWPAASPSVVAVGGTRLSLAADHSYYAEAAWADTLSSGGSGGGVEGAGGPTLRRPEWQRAPGVENRYSTDDRQVPDVSGPADCDSAFYIVYSEDPEWRRSIKGPNGCGTSAAAPFWAAITALVSQYAKAQGVEQIGFLAPLLYEIGRSDRYRTVFHDVQVGGNLLHDAGPGWDYATGLGSPDAWQLAKEVTRRLSTD